MNKRQAWSDKDIQTLKRMWHDNHTCDAIAEAVNRKPSTVRQYVHKYRHDLGLEARRREQLRTYKNISEFDKQWYGSVPLKHWSITQSWSKTK